MQTPCAGMPVPAEEALQLGRWIDATPYHEPTAVAASPLMKSKSPAEES